MIGMDNTNFLIEVLRHKNSQKSTRDLFANLIWSEPTGDGDWKEAPWAAELYEQLSKE